MVRGPFRPDPPVGGAGWSSSRARRAARATASPVAAYTSAALPNFAAGGQTDRMATRLSVIVPTYRSPDALSVVIAGLRRQTASPDDFEVVVVIDGDPDDLAMYEPMVDPLESAGVRIVAPRSHVGRSRARNLGVEAASGDICLFLDGDSTPMAHVVEAHLDAHRSGRTRAAIGFRAEPKIGESWVDSVHTRGEADYERQRRLDVRTDADGEPPQAFDKAPWLLCYTHNISVPRSEVLAVGRFDERLGMKWGWEDLDLFYRLYLRWDRDGTVFEFVPRAIVVHMTGYRHLASWYREAWDTYDYVSRKHNSYADWEFLTPVTRPHEAIGRAHYLLTAVSALERAEGGRSETWLDAIEPRLAGTQSLWWTTSADTVRSRVPDARIADLSRRPGPSNRHFLMRFPPELEESGSLILIDIWRFYTDLDFSAFMSTVPDTVHAIFLLQTAAAVDDSLPMGREALEIFLSSFSRDFHCAIVSNADDTALGIELRRPEAPKTGDRGQQ